MNAASTVARIGVTILLSFLSCFAQSASETSESTGEALVREVLPEAGTAQGFEAEVDRLASQGSLVEARALVAEALVSFPDDEGLRASEEAIGFLQGLESASKPREQPVTTLQDLADARAIELMVARINTRLLQFRLSEAQKLIDQGLERWPESEELQTAQATLTTLSLLKAIGERVKLAVLVGALIVGVFVAMVAALARRRPMTAAGLYIMAVYVFMFPIALAIGCAGAWIDQVAAADGLPVYFRHGSLLVFSCFMGAIGGAINCSIIIENPTKHEMPQSGQFPYFFFKPLNGFYLAGSMYFALLAGYLSIFDGSEGVPEFSAVAVLSVLTGIFSENAIEKLRQVSATLFGSGDAKPKPGLQHRLAGVNDRVVIEPAASENSPLISVRRDG